MYDNYFLYGQWGVGESCHNSQWVYGVGNLYAYTVGAHIISSEGPSPLGIRTFFYNSTFLNAGDGDWCTVSDEQQLMLPQFWNNSVHSPTGKSTGTWCPHGGNTTFATPMPAAQATAIGTAVLAPYPRSSPFSGRRPSRE